MCVQIIVQSFMLRCSYYLFQCMFVCIKYYRKARSLALSRTHPERFSLEVIVSHAFCY